MLTKKNLFLLLAAISILAVIGTACVVTAPPPQPAPAAESGAVEEAAAPAEAVEAPAEKPFDGVEVQLLIFKSLDSDYIEQALAPQLEEETGIKLVVNAIPYEEVRATQLADRAGPKAYDIINSTTEWSYEYAEFAAPLDEYIGKEGYPDIEQEDIIPFVWTTFNPGDDVRLIPYQPDTRIFFYRTDLLEEAGLEPPKTWDELLAAAETLTKDTNEDGQVDQFGFIYPGRRGWNLMLAWVPFVYAAGGEIFTPEGEPAFNSQAGIDAINLLIELQKYAPPDVTAFGEYEVNQTTVQGNAAMGVSASAITPEIEAPDSPVRGLIKSSDFPVQTADTERKFKAALGGWAFGVSDYSDVKDAAAYTVLWLTSKDIVTDMQVHGRQHAARLSMAESPELLAVNPHVPTIVDILSGAEIFYRGPEGAAIGELLNVRIAQAVAGELSPEEALEAAVNDINSYKEE
jgi:multiple sugar transport system substrate-binding protein